MSELKSGLPVSLWIDLQDQPKRIDELNQDMFFLSRDTRASSRDIYHFRTQGTPAIAGDTFTARSRPHSG